MGTGKRFKLLKPFKSIRVTMIFYFAFLIVTTLLIYSIISLNYTEKTIMENSIDYTSRLINQVNWDIDSYIEYMENISSVMVNGGDVQNYLYLEMGTEDKTQLYKRIVTQFDTVVETRQDISNIGVIASGNEYIINNGNDTLNENISLENVEWYDKALSSKERVLTASHVQNVIRNNYKWVVTLSRGIVNPATNENEGIFFIDLNYKLLKDLCENNSLGVNSYVFIMDETGKIIYHPKQQLLYSGLMEEKIDEVLESDSNYFVTREGKDSKLYTISVSEKTGWSVVGVAYLSELMKNKEGTQRLYILMAILLFLCAAFLATLLASAITRPIKELKDSMKEVEHGNFERASVIVRSDNEIGSLSKSFNLMAIKIEQLMEQNIYEQKQKRKSEMKALRSQINPHFLYNTLDSIIWMAEGNKNKEVVLMTSALARLLRQSISNDNERIPLEKEMEYVRSYLTIQKMRYKDKLEYEINLEPDIKKELVINLILQPLVENAIYHGIKYKGTKGTIIIEGYKEGENIILKVADDGIGMEKEVIENIFTKSKENEERNGVGVYNVHSRIKLYYGEEYGLHFESVVSEGTVATITIPKSHTEERNV